MEAVNKAIEEYRESPFIANLRRLCALDKALLVCICRHVARSGSLGMTIEDVMDRFEDLMQELRMNTEISLVIPPMSVLFERLLVMLQRGIVGKRIDSRGGGENRGIRDITRRSVFHMSIQARDVKTALMDSPFSKYLPGIGMLS